MVRGVRQVVVQGIPWKFEDADLMALFEGSGAMEEAKVVIGKDGRSRVSPCPRKCASLGAHCCHRGASLQHQLRILMCLQSCGLLRGGTAMQSCTFWLAWLHAGLRHGALCQPGGCSEGHRGPPWY